MLNTQYLPSLARHGCLVQRKAFYKDVCCHNAGNDGERMMKRHKGRKTSGYNRVKVWSIHPLSPAHVAIVMIWQTEKTNYREQGSGMRGYLTVYRDVCYTTSHPDWLSDRADNLVSSLSVTGHSPHVVHSCCGREGKVGREGKGWKRRGGKKAAAVLKTPTSAGSISRVIKHGRRAGWQRQVWPETQYS